ncbi:MAG: helix-turn-helix transcriptional regulator [Leptothrix sp. (in: b-proteobacteria)]
MWQDSALQEESAWQEATTSGCGPFIGMDAGFVFLLSCVIDELDYGLAVVTAQGRVLIANRMARQRWAEPQSEHQLIDHRLHAREAQADIALGQALNAAAAGQRRLLCVGDQRHELAAAMIPLGATSAAQRCVLVVYGKCLVCEQLSVDFYARTHGLTDAENRVLAALCAGDTPNTAARRYGVEVSTIRSQVASIRHKTQARSIADLVRKVAVLPPILTALGRVMH